MNRQHTSLLGSKGTLKSFDRRSSSLLLPLDSFLFGVHINKFVYINNYYCVHFFYFNFVCLFALLIHSLVMNVSDSEPLSRKATERTALLCSLVTHRTRRHTSIVESIALSIRLPFALIGREQPRLDARYRKAAKWHTILPIAGHRPKCRCLVVALARLPAQNRQNMMTIPISVHCVRSARKYSAS